MNRFFHVLLMLVLMAAGASPATADERSVSDNCRAAMTRDWPKVAGLHDQTAMKAALPLFPALRAACANDGQALDDLALAEGTDQFYLKKPSAAVEALDTHKPAPGSADYVQAEWLYLSTTQATGDAARFLKERDAFLKAHDAALRNHPGITKLPSFETPLARVDAYQTKDPESPFVFIGSPKDGSEPVSLVVQAEFPVRDEIYYTYRAYACWLSSPEGGAQLPAGKGPDYADVKAAVVKAFSEKTEKPDAVFDQSIFVPFGTSASKIQPCANAKNLLPAFADSAPLTGAEYVAPGATLTEDQLGTMLQGTSAQKNRAIAYIESHPDSVPPFDYIYMIGDLMGRGDLEQAAFWYYVYQIRVAPWKTPRAEPSADYSNEIYGAIAEALGRPINEWAGSDFEGVRSLMLRASSYERKMPLYPGRPDGVDDEQWASRIDDSRRSHDAATLDKIAPDTPEAREKSESARKAHGLYVGPWKSPGAPLPDEWK